MIERIVYFQVTAHFIPLIALYIFVGTLRKLAKRREGRLLKEVQVVLQIPKVLG